MTSAAAVSPPLRLEVSNLSKTFGPAQVLREVSLHVGPGELHGLVGQNGCGKSTLVKILTGVYSPDPGGSVTVDGRRLPTPIQPSDQRAAGLSVVHQNLGLVDHMTVWENVRLGRYRARGLLRYVDRTQERDAVAQVLQRLGRSLDPHEKVAALSAEDRAVVAIARAMQDHRPGAGLIIFDESTRALGRDARARFFDIVGSILFGGGSVLLVSHQLEEIVERTDRVTVLRDGEVVESAVATSEVDEAKLTRMMLGRHLITHEHAAGPVRLPDEAAAPKAAVVASVSGLAVGQVEGFELTVGSGAIVGLTGLVGSGFELVAEALGGARRARSGELRIGERVLNLAGRRGSTEEFVQSGVGYVPERRLDEGLAAELSVTENLTLPWLRDRGRRTWTGSGWQAEQARDMITKLDIRPPDPRAAVGTLSGGNQQKVLLGKWLVGGPRLLVLQEPTQAVDVGARHDIIDVVRAAAADGRAVVVASVDAADLSVLCDRVLVFRDGRVVADLAGDLSQDDIIAATFGDTPGPA